MTRAQVAAQYRQLQRALYPFVFKYQGMREWYYWRSMAEIYRAAQEQEAYFRG